MRYRKLGKAEGDAGGEPAIKAKTEFSPLLGRGFFAFGPVLPHGDKGGHS
jgi:hypothetical protein